MGKGGKDGRVVPLSTLLFPSFLFPLSSFLSLSHKHPKTLVRPITRAGVDLPRRRMTFRSGVQPTSNHQGMKRKWKKGQPRHNVGIENKRRKEKGTLPPSPHRTQARGRGDSRQVTKRDVSQTRGPSVGTGNPGVYQIQGLSQERETN